MRAMRLLLSSGAPLHPEERRAIRTRLCPNFCEYYASTEGGGVSLLRPEDMDVHDDSVGRPVFGVEVAIWTVGLLVLSGQSLAEGWRKLLNPVFITLLVAIAVNVAGLAPLIPKVGTTTIHALAVCGIPRGLIMTGVNLAKYLNEPRGLFDAKVSIAALALRLGLLPVMILLLARYLPLSLELKRVLVVQAAMPAGVVPIIIARLYGGHTRTAVQIVLGTTAIGILTIPLWLRAGLAWVGVAAP